MRILIEEVPGARMEWCGKARFGAAAVAFQEINRVSRVHAFRD